MTTSLALVEVRSLDDIADSIRSHYARGFEAYLAIGRDLAEARGQFAGDREFGQWFGTQGFDFSRQWARTLRLAGENEPAVRKVLTTQVDSGKAANIKAAVAAVVHPESVVTGEVEEPIDRLPSWQLLTDVMHVVEELAVSDAAQIASGVPNRRRAATARKLRKLGTYLGRIAWMLEGQES